MGSAMFLLILFLAVGALMVTILKYRIHPVFSIFCVAILLAIALGNTPIEAINVINQGFGGTLSSIGIVMILGSIIAMGIQDTGAATSIANYFIRVTKGKNIELAPALTGYVLSIPVFGDITIILMAPIANLLAYRKKMSMARMATFVQLGLNFTHALVPPTPGVLAVVFMMGADLGVVISFGILTTIMAFFIVWILLKSWTDKEYIPPNPEFVAGEKPIEDNENNANNNDVSSLIIEEDNLPPVWHAFLPLLVPVILISLASYGKLIFPEGSLILQFLGFVGDRVVSLLIGVFIALTLVKGRINKVKEKMVIADPKIDTNGPLSYLLLNGWVKRALVLVVTPLLITAMGGAFGQILRNAPQAKVIAEAIAGTNILPIFVPWLIAVVMMTCVGSMTMGQLTAAAIVTPMLPLLGISAEAAVLATGAGVLAINHVNNSGFWVLSGFYNLNARQGIKYITIPGAVASVVCIILIAIFSQMGIL